MFLKYFFNIKCKLCKYISLSCCTIKCCTIECDKNESYDGISIDEEWNEIFNDLKSEDL